MNWKQAAVVGVAMGIGTVIGSALATYVRGKFGTAA